MMGIRKAEIKDARVLARIHISAWKKAYRHIVSPGFLQKLDEKKRAESFQKAIAGNPEETFLIEDKGKVVGFTTIGECRDDDKDRDVGEIWGLYIDPDYWRKGYGKKLTEFSEKTLRDRKKTKVVLWVLEKNNIARDFYRKNGFVIEGGSGILEYLGNAKVIRYIKPVE